MSGDRVFIETICQNPSDLDARAVFADWLMDQSNPRGTFIAQQIQLGQMNGFEKDYPELLANTLRLEGKHAGHWLKPILKGFKVEQEDYGRVKIDRLQNARFENGFLSRVAIDPEEVEKNWGGLSSKEPVTGVELLVMEGLPEDLAAPTAAKQWRELKVAPEGWVMGHTIARIMNWGLENLESLDLSGCDLGLDSAKFLVGEETNLGEFFDDHQPPPPLTKKLRHLKLQNTKLGDEGLQLLFNFKPLTGLETLDVSQCVAGDSKTLQCLKNLKKLKQLSIGGNQFDLSELADWPVLKKLESVSLPQEITSETFEQLFPKPSTKLKELNLSSAKSLLEAPAVVANASKKFFHLNIGSTSLGDERLETLLSQKSLKPVVKLWLNKCGLSDKGIEALIDAKLSRLVLLDISSNKLTDGAIQMLVDSGCLKNLVSLRIRNNRKLTSASYEALIAAEDFDPVLLDVGKCKDKKVEKQLIDRFGDSIVF